MRKILTLVKIFSKKDRVHFFYLIILFIFSALIDVLGIASILPFIAIALNPDKIKDIEVLNWSYIFFEFENHFEFLLFLGIAVFFILLISLSLKAYTNFKQIRFCMFQEYQIGVRLLEGYLNQPYEWFLTENSSELGKKILSEVGIVVYKVVVPAVTLVAQSVTVLALLALLVWIDPIMVSLLLASLSLLYGLVYKLAGNILTKSGEETLTANKNRFISLAETFGAIKEIRVAGLEETYKERFRMAAERFASCQAVAQIVGHIPRFVLEGIAFGGLLLVIVVQMSGDNLVIDVIPKLGLFAFIGYRLLPSIQNIYTSITQLKFADPIVDSLSKELKDSIETGIAPEAGAKLLNGGIRLSQVCYTYPGSTKEVLRDLSFDISDRKIVGIVGATGSGKSTLLNLLLGLIQPGRGAMYVGSTLLSSTNIKNWQQTIGYVPQHIYMSDDTVAANVALGVDPDTVDIGALETACVKAEIFDLIDELPKGFQTVIGERGSRLSGGQCQRIGIARAVFRKPKVLILDEATSALDTITEKLVINNLTQLDYVETIILVTHRLATLQSCDCVLALKNGAIAKILDPSDLEGDENAVTDMLRDVQ